MNKKKTPSSGLGVAMKHLVVVQFFPSKKKQSTSDFDIESFEIEYISPVTKVCACFVATYELNVH
jgi:hypothetical protein